MRVLAQYESGGSWFNAPLCDGGTTCFDRNPANCNINFHSSDGLDRFQDYWDETRPLTCANQGDILPANLPGGQTLCHFNWRIKATFENLDTGTNMLSQFGGERAKTCM